MDVLKINDDDDEPHYYALLYSAQMMNLIITPSFIVLICLKHPTGMAPTAYTSHVLDPHYKAVLL